MLETAKDHIAYQRCSKFYSISARGDFQARYSHPTEAHADVSNLHERGDEFELSLYSDLPSAQHCRVRQPFTCISKPK